MTDSESEPDLTNSTEERTDASRVVLADGGDAKVIGYNETKTGEVYGVKGSVVSSAGFGLYTPDNAKIDGTLVCDLIQSSGAMTINTDVGTRALRLGVPGTDNNDFTAGANVLAGHISNNIAAGAVGAVVAGGGNGSTDGGNTVTDNYGTVGGGFGNQAGDGGNDPEDATFGTVCGGRNNVAEFRYTTVGGGRNNLAAGAYSTVSGGGPTKTTTDPDGTRNTAYASYGTIAGGGNNTVGLDSEIAGVYGPTVGGGRNNTASSADATIAGGLGNTASADYSTVAGGQYNTASGESSTVAGGHNNVAEANYGTVAGGGPTDLENSQSTSNVVYDNYGTIGGGGNNQAGSDDGDTQDTTNAEYATVGGGRKNKASATETTVGGGAKNEATNTSGTVAGGFDNTASGPGSTVGGGGFNEAGGRDATVGGGNNNSASANSATVPGGKNNTASANYSTAVGRKATANKAGAFVVGDSSDTEIQAGSSDVAQFQTDVVIDSIQSDTGTNVVVNSNDELAVESSSARHKTNVQPHSTSGGVLDLKLRRFEYENSGSEDVGFIAEEVEQRVPEIVTYDDEDRPYGVKYDRVGVHLLPEVRENRNRLADVECEHDATSERISELEAALDERDDRIDKLEDENDGLRAENEQLRDRIAAIEAELGIADGQ